MVRARLPRRRALLPANSGLKPGHAANLRSVQFADPTLAQPAIASSNSRRILESPLESTFW